jgi:hypothetical protein
MVHSINVGFNTSDYNRRLNTSQAVVTIQGAFSERYHQTVTGRAQIKDYVRGKLEPLTTLTDILQMFSFLHRLRWIPTLTHRCFSPACIDRQQTAR